MSKQRRLLIIGCSRRKRKGAPKAPAWDVYDGGAFRILRKLKREGNFPAEVDLVILSAKYGLISPRRLIGTYDVQMTKPIAEKQRAANRKKLSGLLRQEPYSEIFLNLGKNYIEAMGDFTTLLRTRARLIVAQGPIGIKNQAMKNWLLRSACR